MKTLAPLVTIKAFRERKAELAVLAQRRVLLQAEGERDDAEQALDTFRREATAREQRLYRELCTRVVHLHEIDHVRAQVSEMRSEETEHEQTLDAAEQRRDQAEHQLDDDRAAHAEARRMHDKFVELAEVFATEARALAECKEEAEIEEASERFAGRQEVIDEQHARR